jgi:chromate transporter
VVGGACFILPATGIVLALAWSYVRYGTTTVGRGLLYGITPVVIGIVADAVLRLGRVALRNWFHVLVGAAALAGYFAGLSVLLLLVGAGLVEMVVRNAGRFRPPGPAAALVLGASAGHHLAVRARPSLGEVFGEFLKLGVVVFGSGYVLLAYLQRDLVDRLHWLSARQLVDAISVGQLTPGPVFTTATFVGYLVAGFWGGVVATFGIFLPSFLMVAAFGWLIPVLRRSPWTGSFLDGVNAAVVGLMAGVTVDLGRSAVVDVLTAVLAAAAFVVMWRWRPNFVWLIAAGAAVGVVHALV